jgi:hypothetical protein
MSDLFDDKQQKIKEYKKQWALKNKEKLREHKRKYYEDNKQKLLEKQKIYYEANKEEIQDKNKKYNKSNGSIQKKVRRHKEEDLSKGRENDINYDYVINLLQSQDYKCNKCNILVKLSWNDKYDEQQFSINRINNDIGHMKGNVEITCLYCNRVLSR